MSFSSARLTERNHGTLSSVQRVLKERKHSAREDLVVRGRLWKKAIHGELAVVREGLVVAVQARVVEHATPRYRINGQCVKGTKFAFVFPEGPLAHADSEPLVTRRRP